MHALRYGRRAMVATLVAVCLGGCGTVSTDSLLDPRLKPVTPTQRAADMQKTALDRYHVVARDGDWVRVDGGGGNPALHDVLHACDAIGMRYKAHQYLATVQGWTTSADVQCQPRARGGK